MTILMVVLNEQPKSIMSIEGAKDTAIELNSLVKHLIWLAGEWEWL